MCSVEKGIEEAGDGSAERGIALGFGYQRIVGDFLRLVLVL